MCCRDQQPIVKPAKPAVVDALDFLVQMYNDVHTGDRCNTEAGHWVNEAFIIRLCAVLEAHHVVGGGKSLDRSLPGWKRVDLCRRLRNKFAHATGEIHDQDSRTLDAEIKREFGLGNQESIFEGRFILSKDAVLQPMLLSCRQYACALLALETAKDESVAGG